MHSKADDAVERHVESIRHALGYISPLAAIERVDFLAALARERGEQSDAWYGVARGFKESSKAERARADEAEARLERVREERNELGDAAASVIEQMLKGNWRDDHGHDVRLCKAMLELKDALARAAIDGEG